MFTCSALSFSFSPVIPWFVCRSVGRTAGGFVFPPPIAPLLLFYYFYYLYVTRGGICVPQFLVLGPLFIFFFDKKKQSYLFLRRLFFPLFLYILFFGIECDHKVDNSSMKRIEGIGYTI